MIKHYLTLLFSWFCLSLVSGTGILIEQAGGNGVACDPGGIATFVLHVSNLTSDVVEAKPDEALPPGWVVVAGKAPVSLSPGEVAVRLLSVRVSANAPAGIYSLRYSLRDLGNAAVSGSLDLEIVVKPTRSLQLIPLYAPEVVVAGKDIRATFMLQNTGNVPQDIAVVTKNCALLDAGPFYLEPKETRELAVIARTVVTLAKEGKVFMTVEAAAIDQPDSVASSYHVVRVMPNGRVYEDSESDISAYARLSQLTRKWQDGNVATGFQGELFMSGALDEAGQNKLELKLRGPDRLGLSILGQYDEYYANFQNEKLYAHLGDKAFSLTPLTQFFRYGRGAEASIRSGAYEFGGFYLQPRFYSSTESEAAGYIRYHHPAGHQLSANLMRKQLGSERGDALLASFHSLLQLWEHTIVEAELSTGNLGAARGSGAYLRLHSQPVKKLTLASNLVYAGKNYPGFFTNTLSFYGEINYLPVSKLGLTVLVNQDASNASQDTLFGVAPWSRISQAGANYHVGKQFTLRSFIRQMELRDQMPDAKFHFKEDLLRLQVAKTTGLLTFAMSGEFGTRENLMLNGQEGLSRTLRASLDLHLKLRQRHTFSGIAQYHEFKNAFTGAKKQFIFGGGVNSALSAHSRLRLFFQTNYLPEQYHQNRNLLNFSFTQKVGKRKKHELYAQANYVLLQRTQQQRDFSLQVGYTWLFGIRTQKIPQGQTLRGIITNAGATSVEGVVLELNGQRVKTKPDGSFAFENVQPGQYYLLLDPTSINIYEVTDIPMPLGVAVREGEDKWIGFSLTRSVTIKGNIDIEPEPKSTSLSGPDGPSRVFALEISKGTERLRRLADRSGYFEFPDLRPGTWHLKILNAESYHGFYFEQSEWELEIHPGESKHIHIKVFRKKREIKFQDKPLLFGTKTATDTLDTQLAIFTHSSQSDKNAKEDHRSLTAPVFVEVPPIVGAIHGVEQLQPDHTGHRADGHRAFQLEYHPLSDSSDGSRRTFDHRQRGDQQHQVAELYLSHRPGWLPPDDHRKSHGRNGPDRHFFVCTSRSLYRQRGRNARFPDGTGDA